MQGRVLLVLVGLLAAAPAAAADSGIGTASRAVRADVAWAAGFRGGSAELALLGDTGDIKAGHPFFSHLTIVSPAAPAVSCSSECERSTERASMAVSAGTWQVIGHEDDLGVAFGVEAVLDGARLTSSAFSPFMWAGGLGQAGLAGASDPAEAVLVAGGSVPLQDDDQAARLLDMAIERFGYSAAAAAGNAGPGAATVQSPSSSYNALSVGGFETSGTVGPADDVIASTSAGGPTPGGRKKPDLVAVHSAEVACWSFDEEPSSCSGSSPLVRPRSGTSYAAAQVAAAAVLLADAGVGDPAARKALLLNTATAGRRTPGDAMGTQDGWQPDWGWGALDVGRAVAERGNVARGALPAHEVAFYGTSVSAGDRATLVWQRRLSGCFAQESCGQPPTGLPLTDLDLSEWDRATGQPRANSFSDIDNVEQVRAGTAADVVYKVEAASPVADAAAEPFAIAGARPLTPLAVPRAVIGMEASTVRAQPQEPVTIAASVTNASADLSAEDARVAIALPDGVELAPGSGPPSRQLGTLAPAEMRQVDWIVQSASEGQYELRAEASTERFGATFAAAPRLRALAVSAPPPPPVPSPTPTVAPTPTATSTWAPPPTPTASAAPGPSPTATATPSPTSTAPAPALLRIRVLKSQRGGRVRVRVTHAGRGRVALVVRSRRSREAYSLPPGQTVSLRLPQRLRHRRVELIFAYAGDAATAPARRVRRIRTR